MTPRQQYDELQRSWSHADGRWRELADRWSDAVRHDFESRFWSRLQGETPRYLHDLRVLIEVIEETDSALSGR